MRGGTDRQGYTIIEVMIFLAVSGLMFVLAAVFISGKQDGVQSKQAMNDLNTQIQDVINNVGNGYYQPLPSGYQCNSSAAPTPLTFTTGTPTQGANQGCTFLGEVLQFDTSDYKVYTVAGNQYADGSATGASPQHQLATNFAQANPTLVTNPNLTQKVALEYGLTITNVFSNATSRGAIGFFGSFGQYDASQEMLNSGSQSINMVVLPNSVLSGTPSASDITDANVVSDPNVVICLEDGSQKGYLTIGSDGQRLTTDLEYGSGGGCTPS